LKFISAITKIINIYITTRIKFEEAEYSLFNTESRVLMKYGKFPDGDLYTDIIQNVFDTKHKFTAQASKSCSLQNLFKSIGVNDTKSCTYIHTPPALQLFIQFLSANLIPKKMIKLLFV
jgi:hypothetical protein